MLTPSLAREGTGETRSRSSRTWPRSWSTATTSGGILELPVDVDGCERA